MGLTCGMSCLKYLLFAFNFIFWVAGIAVMAVGIWSRVEAKDWDSLLGEDDTISTAANIMIVAGVFVMVIGFLGCCGAIRTSKWMLLTYAFLLFVIFVLEIAAGIYAYKNKDDVLDKLETEFGKAVKNSYGESGKSNEGLTDAVDWFHKELKCCGAQNASEWAASEWYKKATNKSLVVPNTCCKDRSMAACNYAKDQVIENLATIYKEGCVDKGKDFIKDHMWEVAGAGVGLAFVQIFGIVAAILLCRAIGKEEFA